MRKAGVALRNERVRDEAEFAEWMRRYGVWREETLGAAAKSSPVLHDLIEIVNEVGPIPANVEVFCPEHKRLVGKMSEMLRRIDKYLTDRQ
jgi:hypothetical protein